MWGDKLGECGYVDIWIASGGFQVRIECVELSGSPRQMGRQHGEQFAAPIAGFARDRLERCVKAAAKKGLTVRAEQVLDFCQSILEHHRRYAPEVYEEFCGIAEGAGLSLGMLMICNGLTDIADAVVRQAKVAGQADVGGCSAWMAAPDATKDGVVLAGQTWDMHKSAQQYVVVFRRRPKDGPATLGITTVGCLCLAGINEAGIAIGNNNLQPDDAGQGVMYLAMITHALAQNSLAAAVNAITAPRRCSGHNYYLAAADGSLVNVETTAEAFEVVEPAGSFYVHTNHYLTEKLQPRQPEQPTESSLYRLDRLGRRMYDRVGQIDILTMMEIMADRSGQGACNICRSDPADPSGTCASIIMSPAGGLIWATKGPPADNPFIQFSLAG